MIRLIKDDSGVKAVELGVSIFLVAVLAGTAFASIGGLTDGVNEVAAAADLRSAIVANDGEPPAEDVSVAGVQLVRSSDLLATCLWTTSESGTVLGVWESQGKRLYGRFDVKPVLCPNAAQAEDLGFDTRNSAHGVPKSRVIDTAFTWGDDQPPCTSWHDTVIYELHVKGFTIQHPHGSQSDHHPSRIISQYSDYMINAAVIKDHSDAGLEELLA